MCYLLIVFVCFLFLSILYFFHEYSQSNPQQYPISKIHKQSLTCYVSQLMSIIQFMKNYHHHQLSSASKAQRITTQSYEPWARIKEQRFGECECFVFWDYGLMCQVQANYDVLRVIDGMDLKIRKGMLEVEGCGVSKSQYIIVVGFQDPAQFITDEISIIKEKISSKGNYELFQQPKQLLRWAPVELISIYDKNPSSLTTQYSNTYLLVHDDPQIPKINEKIIDFFDNKLQNFGKTIKHSKVCQILKRETIQRKKNIYIWIVNIGVSLLEIYGAMDQDMEGIRFERLTIQIYFSVNKSQTVLNSVIKILKEKQQIEKNQITISCDPKSSECIYKAPDLQHSLRIYYHLLTNKIVSLNTKFLASPSYILFEYLMPKNLTEFINQCQQNQISLCFKEELNQNLANHKFMIISYDTDAFMILVYQKFRNDRVRNWRIQEATRKLQIVGSSQKDQESIMSVLKEYQHQIKLQCSLSGQILIIFKDPITAIHNFNLLKQSQYSRLQFLRSSQDQINQTKQI